MALKIEEDITVLVIDDSTDIIVLIKAILDNELIHTICASSAKEAWPLLNKNIDVIVLDLMMPEVSGRDFLIEFRKLEEYSNVRVIVLTAESNDDQEIARLFEAGANDYIKKPFFPAEFISRVKNHANHMHLTKALKNYNMKLKKKNAQLLEVVKREEFLNKRILDRTFKLKKAYSKIEKLNEQLKYTSTRDKLTATYNRGAILTFLQNDIQRVKRLNTPLTLIMLDFDFFKKVNDTYGHRAGDQVLQSLSMVLKKSIREIDLIGRYGGEEFIIILPDTTLDHSLILCERLIHVARVNKIDIVKTVITQTISMGVTQYINEETIDQFIERADTALYQAKESGRDRYITI
ncbi:MAG: hypothetical protein A2015_10810 [Spirochaetes bacterium GWF1_31_7]|nr:MAG: hypothetical protein A2Y30_12945 [Spirochaetes bacterium GWE1_32_154]OHD48349.1 MAG: hypothetical protein A2015_10810 [Spirochaetes bacterium GWF1_31_7]OHD51616.1 MAG: hypothetical protein A2Y29_15005 [Spirochaetes bacterium GWE2_31_10]